jgi:hypothetical protein
MYLVACAAKNPLEVEFTRRAIEHIMWFDWHGYHTSKINQMVEWGWITV